MALGKTLVTGRNDGRKFPKQMVLGAVGQTFVDRFRLSYVRSLLGVIIGIWAIEDVYPGSRCLISVEEVGKCWVVCNHDRPSPSVKRRNRQS